MRARCIRNEVAADEEAGGRREGEGNGGREGGRADRLGPAPE